MGAQIKHLTNRLDTIEPRLDIIESSVNPHHEEVEL